MKAFVFIVVLALASATLAIPYQINYQGHLTNPGGSPLDTTVAMTFRLYGVASGGTAAWTEARPSVTVVDGLFNVSLGSIAALPDSFAVNRWLGITVGNNSEMIPRQQVTSVAHAYRVGTVDGASGGIIGSPVWIYGDLQVGDANTITATDGIVVGSDNQLHGYRSSITGGSDNIVAANAGHSHVGGGAGNIIYTLSDFATIGGGNANIIDSVQHATIGGGNGNWVAGEFGTIAGGRLNQVLSDGTVGGGIGNRCWGSASVIAGGDSNLIEGGFANAILGGVGNGIDAVIFGAVGGGQGNGVGADYGYVGGGFLNGANSTAAVVPGGMYNSASGLRATVCGGFTNTASGTEATVAGGSNNTANGYRSFVAGGGSNEASHNFCFAGGNNSHAIHSGAFVWGDGWGTNLTSSANDQFSIRASGGLRFFTNNSHTSGVTMAAGGNSWVTVSDSTKKRDVRFADSKAVLDKLNALSIKEWEYKSEEEGIEHMGPMAQDFWNTFHLGSDSLGISTIDADGVLFAAVQELAKQNQVQAEEIAELKELVKQLVQIGHK